MINRGRNREVGDRFIQLMRDYAARAVAVRSAFEMNPSPGNIEDGLITDAIKSAGAARKGGIPSYEDRIASLDKLVSRARPRAAA